MIKQTADKLLETALNQYLSLSPQALDKLKPLAGKTIEIVLAPPNITLLLQPSDAGITLAQTPIKTDAKITLSPGSLITLATTDDLPNDMTIEGDIQAAQLMSDCLKDMEIDWQSYLANYIGNSPAYQINQCMQDTIKWGKSVKASLKRQTADYLKEESKLCPRREEVSDFSNHVDQAREDVDRIAAKIERLQKQRGQDA